MASKTKKPTWEEVACPKHGRSSADPHIPLSVRLSSRLGKAERQGLKGCPACKREQNKEKSKVK